MAHIHYMAVAHTRAIINFINSEAVYIIRTAYYIKFDEIITKTHFSAFQVSQNASRCDMLQTW